MTIKTITPGKTKMSFINEGIQLYLKRIQHYLPVEYSELKEIKIQSNMEANRKSENDLSLLNKVSDMQLWLIRNKQTNNWKTTKATADACYAILASNDNMLDADRNVKICLGKKIIEPKDDVEKGTGYFKQRIEGNNVNASMGKIDVEIKSIHLGVPVDIGIEHPLYPTWGAVYWQYFQDMDAVTPAATPLSLNKKLFIERNTSSGKIIEPVSDINNLKVGDKVIVRIELRSDRDMEYIHLKDMRAANMEPVNVLSSYKWQDGLGYYESTKDIATDFFISNMAKGTYVFEYLVRITHTGQFSAGIATVQCMYAPEYSSHSEGFRVIVGE